MNRRWMGFATLLVLSLPRCLSAQGQCKDCNLRERGNRFEGVANRQVAAGGCDLLGVQRKRPVEADTGSNLLFLHFWLPKPSTPTIEVWHPEVNYWMLPKETPYPKGTQRFSWPRAEVVEPLGLHPEGLHVKVSNRDKTLYYPALLSFREKPSPAAGYVHTFKCGAGIDVDITISTESEGTVKTIRAFRYSQEFGGIFPVEWDGLDSQGKQAPPGVYVLRLKGELLAEKIRPLNRSVTFQHGGLE